VRYFPSERALSFTLITWVLVPAVLVATLIAMFLDPSPWWVWVLTGVLPAALVQGLMGWIYFRTGYTVTEKELVIQSAFITWRVPLASIRFVRPTRSPLTSPALSMNRLEIRTGKGFAPLISPQDRPGFLALLRERCPQADIQG